jgi:cold shock protein
MGRASVPLHISLRRRWDVAIGTVKSFDRDKGVGFLSVEGGKDVFFRKSAVTGEETGSLAVGSKVEFRVAEGPKGPQAHDIRVIASG